jgi:EAL domain-containing protein (putative c-di-GMP-specific phosphodiesterase class I)
MLPGMLQLEITERVVAEDGEETTAALRDLRELGVTISLDDFGTGYSSLLRLQSLPVDELKIDRVFVSCLSRGGEAVGIVRAVIDLAHALGLPAVAEGVETKDEWQTACRAGTSPAPCRPRRRPSGCAAGPRSRTFRDSPAPRPEALGSGASGPTAAGFS